MHHPPDRIAHTTAFVAPVVEHWLEREIAQWAHPIKDRSDDRSHHERTLLPWSYISLPMTKRACSNWVQNEFMFIMVYSKAILPGFYTGQTGNELQHTIAGHREQTNIK